jgi:hypothetical protein
MTKPGQSGGPVHINVRLRTTTGVPPTAVSVRAILREILATGVVPDGWEFAWIDWKNPKRASRGWLRGSLDDMETLGAVIRASLTKCRISIVRPLPKDVLQGQANEAER